MHVRRAAGTFTALTILATGVAAYAQQPTPDQVNAIRSSCRSDFMSHCAGVTPGGADAFACLRSHVAQLSAPCQTAVNAATPRPAAPPAAASAAAPAPVATAPAPTAPAPVAAAALPAAAAQPMAVPSADQVAAIRASCPADFQAHCAGVPPGGMEGLACLQRNAAQLSAPCRFAVVGSGPPVAPAAPAVAPPPAAAAASPVPAPSHTAAAVPAAPAAARPAAVVAAPAAAPSAAQKAAIRTACQSDFMARCPGVQPGGPEAFACLKRNASSPACKQALASVGAPAGAVAAAPAAAAVAAPAAPPTAEQQAAIRASCRSDFMSKCSGVQPGGADALACLKRNSATLSPACQQAVAAIGTGAAPAATTAAAAPAPRPALFPLRRAIRERMMER